MRALLIHQAFAGPHDAGGTRHFELARRLVERGHAFTIVTSNVTYLTGERAGRGWFRAESHDGVRIVRVATPRTLHRSYWWRLVAFVTFMLTSVVAALRAGRVDVVMGTSPQMLQALSAWLVSAVRRRPFLLEIRDLWPEFAIDVGLLRNRLLIGVARALERFLYRRATHLLVNSPAYRSYLIEHGVPEAKITVVPNGVDPDCFVVESAARENARRELGVDDRFVVMYAGALGMANDIDTILAAAARTADDDSVRWVLVGDGKERARLTARAETMGLNNVQFAGARPKSDMPALLAAADACVATLRDVPMFRTTYPNKVFDYMAAGRPIVLGIDGVIRDVVERADCGQFVRPGMPDAMAGAVRRFAADRARSRALGRRGRDYVRQHFHRDRHAAQFCALLQSLAAPAARRTWYARRGKRLLDLALTIPLLVLTAPVIAATALLVRVKLGSPVLFRQTRPGFREAPFTMLKFRSMTNARGRDGNLLSDAERLTPFGRFLRSTSLDELPELWNVVRGDMSLVGPRPLLSDYLEEYSDEQARRHQVRPGITGWAQIHGRNALDWDSKLDLDVWYVDHCRLSLDLRILWRTAFSVLRREGIQAEGSATAPRFVGRRRKAA